MADSISATDALAILKAKGVKVSDFTLYGWLESKQIKAYRLPSANGKKPGKWQVDRESVYEFLKRCTPAS